MKNHGLRAQGMLQFQAGLPSSPSLHQGLPTSFSLLFCSLFLSLMRMRLLSERFRYPLCPLSQPTGEDNTSSYARVCVYTDARIQSFYFKVLSCYVNDIKGIYFSRCPLRPPLTFAVTPPLVHAPHQSSSNSLPHPTDPLTGLFAQNSSEMRRANRHVDMYWIGMETTLIMKVSTRCLNTSAK